METEGFVLLGTRVRLEALDHRHVDGLVVAAAADPSLYQWSPVPQGRVEVSSYVDVCFHTDARNNRSRAALERIGGKFEGILRAHRMAADRIARDSARYSIVAAEWPAVKRRLSHLLDQG
jgi:hypothetical protein